MYAQAQQGLMSTYHEGWRRRGIFAWIFSAALIGFYLVLYFTEVLTPVAHAVLLPSKWHLYGVLYCVGMAGGAVYYLRRHGNSRYHSARIAVNLTVQIALATALPLAMHLFGQKEFYFSYLWPLKIEYLYPQVILQHPPLMLIWSLVSAFVLVPVLALLVGKRWYCSWICGCGALANTMGDPWRHLSDKSEAAWRFEKVSIHTVLVIAVGATVLMVVNWSIGQRHPDLAAVAFRVQDVYGFVVGAILSGVVGVGVYPLLGTRVWCRFFCPMAALLGLLQKGGRFRIRVKDDMCISCGNCSTYCEMGIDVRAYAQRNESFTRASCVGCGMCAHVCPRGVLKLENTPRKSRLPVVA